MDDDNDEFTIERRREFSVGCIVAVADVGDCRIVHDNLTSGIRCWIFQIRSEGHF